MGIKGAKQKRRLDENELKLIQEKSVEVKHGNQPKICLLTNDLEEIIATLKISKESLQRRWRVSQNFSKQIIFCYEWKDRFDDSLPNKCYLFYVCDFCNKETILLRRKFLYRKIKTLKSCGGCHAKHVSSLPEQISINREAQKIAQNKPETLKKMSNSIKKAWERDYKERCKSIKKSYENNPSHRENIKLASLRNWSSEEYRKKVEKSNAYCWGYYSDIFYQSLCELAFILWCEDRNIEIKRYDGNSIKYVDEKDVSRNYIPDFVIDSKTIVEVKSSLNREKSLGRLGCVLRKAEAASELCKLNGFGYRIVEIKDLPSSYYRKAGKIHHGKAKEKNVLSLYGKSS